MSGFNIGTPTVPAVSAEPLIENDGWFPAVDPADFRKQNRVRDIVTLERLREAVLAAMIEINLALEGYRAAQIEAGHLMLAAVPSRQFGGESRNVILYRRAISASAKADLVEHYRDMDTTGAGQRQVGELDISVGELRRDALHAVRDLLGQTRTNVELI
ncbi:head completion/stabilization protein [Sphingomonas sp. PB4P5]|uniref:head completion/stabilization protein n=1 Tax=Parasphingomonas puruogangriensis TaxID=3096155 RepID=UPI002FCC08F4